MFRGLLLFALLATSCYAYKGHNSMVVPADSACDYKTAHGFLFFSPNYNTFCDNFFIYHLAELECPHQYIVVAQVSVQPEVKAAYCKAMQSGNETVYGVAPEFVLPQFMNRQIMTFQSQFFQGFFSTVMFNSVTINLMEVNYAQMINIVQPGSLGYYLYEDQQLNRFMTHAITTAPDFDHVILVTIQTDSRNPHRRKGPVYVSFDMPNTYENRLQEGQTYTGQMYAVGIGGKLWPEAINIFVNKNIYPGPNKANGDGLHDFQQFCVEKDRPVWDSCLTLSID